MNRDNRWIHVAAYASLHYGRVLADKTPDEELKNCLSDFSACNPGAEVEAGNPDHQSLVLGLSRLLPKVAYTIEQLLSFAQEVKRHCDRHPNPQVRVRQDIWKNTFDAETSKHQLSFKEFAVLCAIYAAIGKKSYAKISHDYIRCLASGHVNFSEFISRDSEPCTDSLHLSKRQVRKIIDDLEANRFFSKFTYNRGECFYSNRLMRAALSGMICARKTRKLETLAANRSLDQADSHAIKRRVQEASAPFRHMKDFSRSDTFPGGNTFQPRKMPVHPPTPATPKYPDKQRQGQAGLKQGEMFIPKASAAFPKQKPSQEFKWDDTIPKGSGYFMNLLKADSLPAPPGSPPLQNTQKAA
ncbi:MAG: hypothetical protein CJBNEKGG_02545 [Prosthecobacter sp.]|nr:hypothetical protein [Prosthecobacter sp.]